MIDCVVCPINEVTSGVKKATALGSGIGLMGLVISESLMVRWSRRQWAAAVQEIAWLQRGRVGVEVCWCAAPLEVIVVPVGRAVVVMNAQE